MTRCPTCYRPEATDKQRKSGACGKNPEGGCSCGQCLSVCFGGCYVEHRAYAWTKEPPTEPGWYWIRGEGNPPELAHQWRRGWWVTTGEPGNDLVALGYEFLPVPLDVPEFNCSAPATPEPSPSSPRGGERPRPIQPGTSGARS